MSDEERPRPIKPIPSCEQDVADVLVAMVQAINARTAIEGFVRFRVLHPTDDVEPVSLAAEWAWVEADGGTHRKWIGEREP
jgi:hypothetical protein